MDYFRKRKPVTEEELQRKIAALSPELQAEFLRATDTILQKESEIFLQILQNSRDDIVGISKDIRTDQTAFKANANKYDGGGDSRVTTARASNDKLVQFVQKRQKHKKTPTVASTESKDKEKEAVENYLRAVGRAKTDKQESAFDSPRYTTSTTSGPRPGTAFRIRLDDVEPSDYRTNSIESQESQPELSTSNFSQKKEELINKMREQDNQALTERERQMKLLEKKKAERQNKRPTSSGGLASDLIDHSKEVDEKQAQLKLQQERQIQERLGKMRAAADQNNPHRQPSPRPRHDDGGSPRAEMIEMQNQPRDVSNLFQVQSGDMVEDQNGGDTEKKQHRKKHHKKHHKKDTAAPQQMVETDNNVECVDLDD